MPKGTRTLADEPNALDDGDSLKHLQKWLLT